MSARLLFPDPQAAADLLTFSSRTIRLGDGTVRLRARGGVLVTTAAPLAPRGLMDATPTVLGLRASAIDPELECDLVVEASALLPAPDDANAVVLPETASSPAWAGISPPQGGWEQTGVIDASVLASRAQYGVAAVADALPADAGEDVVRVIRAQVWGQPDGALADLPLGVAFAAFALGFIAGSEEAPVRRSGAWTRVSLARGHVLVRGPVRSGLTAVRATGS
ncbi:hypothetical protein SAMN04487848_2161 [Microbacterium sp. ru370.1]|uniref:hypothetical protein n=1 Tax=unclassified Microbacterium TaxID=2609290 RepID=UPI0008889361|nr:MULTISPECIES: hypothetical protein [unclassified Microbacterium]SDO79587.1 hypothetical protein SAMN04487848_2161 [Microbacterium sp. ru370.1]SIT89492.1 hypothetical protein SAMN05880579_2155 [Microbacterium sp. RU1D]